MANSNFVVHNGLTVGPTTIDAATGNIAIPVGKQISVGNVLLFDNGDGKLRARDITNNSDVSIVATLSATSTTQGNIQIGTNHLESTNTDGQISFRPNGVGALWFTSNTIDIGRGGVTTISTGGAAGYAASNIIVQTTGALSSGNIRVPMTTAATSLTTGAFQVIGGAGISGALYVGNIILPNQTSNIQIGPQYVVHANAPLDVSQAANSYVQINVQNIDSVGTQVSADFIATAVDGTDTSKFIDMGINGNLFVSPGGAWTISGANDGYVYIDGGNLTLGTATAGKTVRIHTGGLLSTNVVAEYYAANVTMIGNVNPSTSNLFTLGSTTNWWNKAFTVSATAQYADLAENYVGDASYAAGTVVAFGGTHEITVCDTDMSSRVAGVVSTNPAYLMNGTQTGENIVAVALTGRVPTKVRGPIRKGDLIVSAGDGHARAETLPQVGTVIGKALEDFDGDSGVIEVVVGKH